MNFGTINQISCENVPQPVDSRCSDPAFALANPSICGAGGSSSIGTLIIKPGNALCCLLGSIQFSAVLVVNGSETDVTSETTFSTSNPAVAIIGSSSGNATGIAGGTSTISALYEDDSGNILVASASLDVLGEQNCCDEVQVAVMVLVDVSQSMSQLFGGTYATKLAYAKSAASQFISQMNGNKDLVGLMSFYDGSDTLLSAPSSNPSTVAGLVSGIAQTSQLTGFNKALQDAITQLNGTAANEKVILIISDGQDTSTFDTTDSTDAITTANTFKAAGGFIMCLGCRSAGNDFLLLEALSTGGMFVNGYPSVANSALTYLYGLKGYVCAGNCVPAGDNYVPTPQLHYCGFENWRVYDGQVDLIGDGLNDFLPGNGLYVNLFGSSNETVAPVNAHYTPGQLFSKSSFALQAGHAYRLSFNLAGNQVNDISQSALLKVFGMNSDGLATPTIAPGVVVNESGSTLSQTPTYKYVYTWVNANGETLQSPVTSVTPTESAASMVITPPANQGASAINIYRTTGQSPDSPYYLIATLTSASSYTDYMNESDMLAALSAGTIDSCKTPPSINTSNSEIPLLTQTVSVANYQQPFTAYSFTFTAPNNVQAWISAQQVIQSSSATPLNHGLLLDSVTFSDTTNLETLLSDNFDTENSQYVPPACGIATNYVDGGYAVGYNCYGYGCINSGPLPVQVPDPNPLPNIEAGYTPPMQYNSTQTACVSCPSNSTNLPSIPTATGQSDTSSNGTSSSSGPYSVSSPPFTFNAFLAFLDDGAMWIPDTGAMPVYLQYKFNSAQTIASYSVHVNLPLSQTVLYNGLTITLDGVPFGYPTSWEFQGSNDGTNWTTLDTQTGITFAQPEDRKLFTISSPAAYIYYRINVTEVYYVYGAGEGPLCVISGLAFYSSTGQQVCATASATSTASQSDADSKATAAATAQAQSQLDCAPSYTATESATVTCPTGTAGTPNSVTKSATYTSLISLADAQNQASALAQAAAAAALVNSNCACVSTNGNKMIVNEAPINTGLAGAATPYPSVKCVSGLTGNITKVTVAVNGLNTTSNYNVSLLLQAPDGTTVELMKSCGVPAAGSFSNVVFDDAAGSSISCSGSPPIPPMVPSPSYPNTVNTCPPPSGATVSTFKPTQCSGSQPPAPAPAPQASLPYQTTLASLIGKNPNGTWSLWVFNSSAGDSGSICSWNLNISSS